MARKGRPEAPYRDLLQEGMTQAQVEAKLGVPSDCEGDGRCGGRGKRVSLEVVRGRELDSDLRDEQSLRVRNESVSDTGVSARSSRRTGRGQAQG